MALDPASRIAVVSSCRYRAEALALAISQRSGCKAHAVMRPELNFPTHFSAIVVDVDLGFEAALQLTQAVVSQDSGARVVLLGMIESPENVLRIAEAGASGYITTAASLDQLVSVLGAVENYEFTCPPDITFALFVRYAELARYSTSTVLRSALTTRERRVAELMSRHLTNKEIAAHLYISEFTVKNHVHHILKKLGARNRHLAVQSHPEY
jgi:two-component system, NarL family, nitrate/nitrite response regulator NarL